MTNPARRSKPEWRRGYHPALAPPIHPWQPDLGPGLLEGFDLVEEHGGARLAPVRGLAAGLFREAVEKGRLVGQLLPYLRQVRGDMVSDPQNHAVHARLELLQKVIRRGEPDRKSTRLNSSHLGISYAV